MITEDQLGYKINKNKFKLDLFTGKQIPTKREFLSIIMSIFDPLGFLTPFTIHSRILMQKVWSSGINWDHKLLENEFFKWKQWLGNLTQVQKCRIPRCYQFESSRVTSIELHIFCDASKEANAAVGYWRFSFKDGTFHIAIIMAKSRVAPVKPISTPRLELQAALLAVRLAKTIASEHNLSFTKRIFWSDSSTVLHWIKKDPHCFKSFVMNRLGEIRENSFTKEWRWVPTKDNPADDGTRWAPNALDNNSRWFIGPPFLKKIEKYWPKLKLDTQCKKDVDASEFRTENIFVITTQTFVLDFTKYSSWNKLLKTLVCIFKAIEIMKKRIISTRVDLLFQAEEYCLKASQKVSYPFKILVLNNSESILRNSKILNLNPTLDNNGILRANGRVSNFVNDQFCNQPIILDGKNHIARLIIHYYHEKYFHCSHETVINEIRQKYWIVGVRNSLRSLISRCVICKILRAKPQNPKMANLPTARLGYKLNPFAHCGLDYFGPMLVKIGRRREKRWGVLFTCMSTRAIHIELASSLSTDSAIMALQRFIARRGVPLCMYSGNATNFKGASKELVNGVRSLDNKKLENFLTNRKIAWKFNPPSAPHMGGCWERQIRTVKIVLMTILKEQAPKEEVLLTTLTEIEHSVNSRPLTHVSVDPRDQEAITPNHFLIGSSSGEIKFNRHDLQLKCTRK